MPTVVELESLMTRFLGDNSDLLKKLDQIDAKLITTARNLNNTANAGQQVFNRMGSGLQAFSSSVEHTALSLVNLDGGILGVSQRAVKLYADMQTLRVTFEVLTGDVQVANKTLSQLYKFAAETPFEVPEVVAAAKQMLAFGDEADNLVKSMTMLGDVASGLEIPLGQLTYLYGTLKAQGQAMTIDIRQFAMRGIPIYLELGKVLKLVDKDAKQLTDSARARIDKMIEEGRIDFAMVEEAFQNMTKVGGKFSGIMDRQSKELKGMFSNMRDDINATLRSLGENIAKELRLKEAMQGVSDFAKELRNLDPETKRLIVNIVGIGTATGVTVGGLITMQGALTVMGLALGTATTGATLLATALLAVNTAALASGGAAAYYAFNMQGMNEEVARGAELAERRGQVIAKNMAKEADSIREMRNIFDQRAEATKKALESETQLKQLTSQREALIKKVEPMLKEGVNIGPLTIFNPHQLELEEMEREIRTINSAIKATKEGIQNFRKLADGQLQNDPKGNVKEYTQLVDKIKQETRELGLNSMEKIIAKGKADGLNESQLLVLKTLGANYELRKLETDEIEKNNKAKEHLKTTIEALGQSYSDELEALQDLEGLQKVTRLRNEAQRLGIEKDIQQQLQLVEVGAKLVFRQKEINKLRDEAKQLLKEMETPQEKFLEQQALLNKMLQADVINFEQFNKAMDYAYDKMMDATGAAKALEAALHGIDGVLSNSAAARGRINAYLEMLKLMEKKPRVWPVEAPIPKDLHQLSAMPREKFTEAPIPHEKHSDETLATIKATTDLLAGIMRAGLYSRLGQGTSMGPPSPFEHIAPMPRLHTRPFVGPPEPLELIDPFKDPNPLRRDKFNPLAPRNLDLMPNRLPTNPPNKTNEDILDTLKKILEAELKGLTDPDIIVRPADIGE